jgi:hypothetical protein
MKNNKQQTAVEQLISKIPLGMRMQLAELGVDFEQAKQMEKEQAIKLYYQYELYVMMNESDVMTFGQFYKQTFGGGNK